MPIHSVLAPGLEAYLRADFAAAQIAWEEPWKELEGDEKQLCLALVRLAGALHQGEGGRGESAAELYDSCRKVLGELPHAVLGVDVGRLRRRMPARLEKALADAPRIRPAARVPHGLVLRFAVLVVIILGGFAVLRWSPWAHYFSREEIPGVLARLRGTWWAPVLLVVAYAVLSPVGVPASPLMIAGGAVFGTALGTLYNLVGLILGGATTYGLGRLLGRDLIVHLAGRQVKRAERAIARHAGFWGMVSVRFFPFPYFLVNYSAAFTGIPFALFIGSTATGLLITVPIYTYFADTIAHAAAGARAELYVQFGLAVLLLLGLTMTPRLLQARKRRARYRRVLAHRRARPVPAPPRPPADR
jgi:uncharacterized membrane protein YdjX (TVP38/TMEM64 family)